jgi:hypothetical protein
MKYRRKTKIIQYQRKKKAPSLVLVFFIVRKGKERRDKVPSFPHYRNRGDFDSRGTKSLLFLSFGFANKKKAEKAQFSLFLSISV